MLAIDTNIVIRFLTRDHEALARRALEIVGNNEVFVPLTVVLEAEWVLRDVYEMPRDEVIRELRRFCGLERVTVGAADVVERALAYAEGGLDVADALHLAQSSECEAFVTLDKPLARKAMRLPEARVRLA
jgi:predicted nucleic-acid-binding protein